MAQDISPRAFFRFSVPVQRAPAKLRIDGDLKEWSEEHLLPDLTAIEGKPGYAKVYAGWSPEGLSLALHVPNKKKVHCDLRNLLRGDGLILWLDTRDSRMVHRATQYCHSLRVYPRGPKPSDRTPVIQRQRVTWQPELQPPKFDEKKMKAATFVGKGFYNLELFMPSDSLHGYAPEECARLGLFVQVVDHEHGEQFWPCPAPLPFWQDPSLWAAVELV
jgi:hypothetical protein